MPQVNPDVPPPFDQGVFLLHYNRGREAFQEGRYAEARRELEGAQKLRPDDSDVLNLLGLVYFKTNAFPEAEVIYRRLAEENPSVFILHSNLGLILFKQGKLDDAEKYLLRSIELRPNYSKSHLYLGLLYKQRKKLGLALEHLRFAGADKAVREIEQGMRTPAKAPEPAKNVPLSDAEIIRSAMELRTQPGLAPPAAPATPPAPAATRVTAPPASKPQMRPVVRDEVTKTAPIPALREPTAESGQAAARKLQEAVDETPDSIQPRLDLEHKIEGASKTFALHDNGFLEINFARRVYVKRGTVSSYSGNLKFVPDSGLQGTTAATLVKVEGNGRLFVYERGRKTFLLDLNEEFIYVEGGNLLALEESLSFRVEPIYDSTYQRKIDTVKIFGKGSLAISTSIEPLTMRVTPAFPLSISSNALVAWTGNLMASVLDDSAMDDVMIEGTDNSFKIRFDGDGVVVAEQ
jgi:uncharacterized protein (AIM24 family)